MRDDFPETPLYKNLFVDTGDFKLDPEERHLAQPSLNGDAPPHSPITLQYVSDWKKRYGYRSDSDENSDSDPNTDLILETAFVLVLIFSAKFTYACEALIEWNCGVLLV
jgi:hypothetical protein